MSDLSETIEAVLEDPSAANLETLRAAIQMPEAIAAFLALHEYERAARKFTPMHSAHEGYATILEELDEMWDEIKRNHLQRTQEEAIQVAAMGIRFLVDVCRVGEYAKAMAPAN